MLDVIMQRGAAATGSSSRHRYLSRLVECRDLHDLGAFFASKVFLSSLSFWLFALREAASGTSWFIRKRVEGRFLLSDPLLLSVMIDSG